MPETKRPLKVFLCHAHSDKDDVKALYGRLIEDGVDAWLDKEKLLPGQDWELEIRRAVRESDVVVVCLSKEFNNAGFRQKEVRLALDTAMEKPEGEIFIIPARLEVCESLESLRRWHWVDLFEDNGYDMLTRALQTRANSLGATLQAKRSRMPRISSPRVKTEKPIEEDIDTKVKSPRIPSIAARKPFKFKTEYIVAIIGAVATIIAAVISSPLIATRFIQSPAPTATVTTQVQASLTESSVMTLPTGMLSSTHPNPSPGSGFQLGSTIQHSVTAGESLFQIARCYGADFGKVLNVNPQISDPRNLSSDMIINVPNIGIAGTVYGPPCATFYTVQSGDTWQSIASKFNADAAVLMEANQGITLAGGAELLIPSNSALTLLIAPSLLSTLFTVDAEVFPNLDNCYGTTIPPGQVAYFKTITSAGQVTQEVHNPDDQLYKDTGELILGGTPDAESGGYQFCIFNRSASPISYTLEVSLSR